jgi:hypothetical protein
MTSVSSVLAPPPLKAPDASDPKAPEVTADGDANDAGASQPVVQAALPPGQGTRVDQLA